MQGVLLVDKPAGWTSFDVVNYVRRIVARAEDKGPKHIKVGHTGTLDPFATGLLVLLVGKDYTKRAGELSKLDKTYELIIEPRRVTVNRLELVEYDYPEVRLLADVSSGTYIRTLVEDIGGKLAVGAFTTALRRTMIGAHSIDDSQPVAGLDQEKVIDNLLTIVV
jgi:tRNA U55 pseudouridine synthase TruB